MMLLGKYHILFCLIFKTNIFSVSFRIFFFTFQVPPVLSPPFLFNCMLVLLAVKRMRGRMCCAVLLISNVGQVTFFAGFSTEPIPWITK